MNARGARAGIASTLFLLCGVVAMSSPVSSASELAFKAPQVSRAPMMGAARAGNRLVGVGDYGTVLLSDDSGHSWRQAVRVSTRETLTSVSFVDDKKGWAVGHGGIVLATRDAGENWEQIYKAGPDVVLFSVHFTDERNGMAVGAFGYAMSTSDGGRTWRKRLIGMDEQADRHLYQIFVDSDSALWVTTEAGGLFRSGDRGNSFTPSNLPYKGSIWGGLSLRNGSLVVWGMRGHVLLSVDQGRSWRDVKSGTDQAFTAGIQLTSGELVLVGLGGVVARSRDGGHTFTTQIRPERQSHTALLATDGPVQSFTLTGLGGPLQ